MVDEAHITTFAVHPAWRRQRIGERLLLAFLDIAIDRGAHEATLEVRLSNLPARRLYEKYGFRPVGLRPRYYSDDNEDALIMTTEPLAEPADARSDRAAARGARCCARADRARERPAGGHPSPTDPAPTRRERTAPAVDRIVVRRDRRSPSIEGGRRILSNVVASQVALHAPSGGIVPEVAARAHLRWIVPVPRRGLGGRRRRRGTTSTAIAVTYGPGLAGSLLVGINFAKALAWVHDKPLDRREPPRGPRLRRLAARSGRGRGDRGRSRSSRSSRSSSRAATRSSPRCATT